MDKPRTYWDTFDSPYQMGVQKHRMYLMGKLNEIGVSTFLDVGCGTGPLYEINKEYGYGYKGTDYSPSMIEVCKKQFPEGDFEVQDARNLKEKDDSWDAVVLMHALDHLDNYKSAISEAARVARKYVIIILWRSFVQEGTNLNPRNMYGKEEGEDPWEDTYLQEYSRESLETEFKKNGLVIDQIAEGDQLNSDSSHYNFMYILRCDK